MQAVLQLPVSGLHASYFFPPEGIADKFKSFSHKELNRPPFTDPGYIKERIRENKMIFNNGTYKTTDPETDVALMAFSPEARQLLLAQSRELRRLQEMS